MCTDDAAVAPVSEAQPPGSHRARAGLRASTNESPLHLFVAGESIRFFFFGFLVFFPFFVFFSFPNKTQQKKKMKQNEFFCNENKQEEEQQQQKIDGELTLLLLLLSVMEIDPTSRRHIRFQ